MTQARAMAGFVETRQKVTCDVPSSPSPTTRVSSSAGAGSRVACASRTPASPDARMQRTASRRPCTGSVVRPHAGRKASLERQAAPAARHRMCSPCRRGAPPRERSPGRRSTRRPQSERAWRCHVSETRSPVQDDRLPSRTHQPAPGWTPAHRRAARQEPLAPRPAPAGTRRRRDAARQKPRSLACGPSFPRGNHRFSASAKSAS